jgi:ABC-type uncharacterized transport system permease subunit
VASSLDNVSHACFGLSYLAALACEAARLRWPSRPLRLAGLAWGTAGLLAHTAFLLTQHPTPASPEGSLLGVAWVLAVFSLFGSVHHARQAWAVFVLPVVVGLVALSLASTPVAEEASAAPPWLPAERVWGSLHGLLLLLAAVGVSVGFLASVMYLVQAGRLKAKRNPLGGVKLLSLERLEAMNRHAVNAAFLLLSVGLLLGVVLLRHGADLAGNLFAVKILGTLGLWAVFGVLTYLRYGANVSGRRLALGTIVAFALLVLVLASTHPFAVGAVTGRPL